MTSQEFDRLLAFHCAPALAGIKPANLISVREKQNGGLKELLAVYNFHLNRFGIRLEILCRRKAYALLLVYREDILWQELCAEETRRFLARRGYRDWRSPDAVLTCLKRRFRACPVPHEIGVFLGYPLEDVAGFMEHGGRDCKLCGYWKVYSDEEAAKRRFQAYTLCRAEFCRRVWGGASLLRLLSGAAGLAEDTGRGNARPAFPADAEKADPLQEGTAVLPRAVP